MQTAGIILDLYDDQHARVLREKLGAKLELPEKLASMDVLSPEALNQLPNRVFGLVARNGDETLRKYAMHNEAHLVTSLIYFSETGHLLPEEAQKVAAHNLCMGCHWYGVEPTDRLVKLAGLGRIAGGALAASSAPSVMKEEMDQKRSTMDGFRQAQAAGAGVKTADLNGTEMMPNSGTLKGAPIKTRTDTAKGVSTAAKTASGRLLDMVGPQLEWAGPVDITGQEAPRVMKTAEHQHYALLDRYPIATPEQVKQASVYFDEHWGGFTPVDRHVYATNVQDRADAMGLGNVGGMVQEYAGREYGTKVAMELQGRIRRMEGKEKSAMYEALLEKVSELSPYMMTQMLEETDALTGLDQSWNTTTGCADPYRTVFAKTADDARGGEDDEKQWSWNQGSDFVNDVMLKDFARNGRMEIAKLFGDDFAGEFCKDPIPQFEALPDPQKHTMARLAVTTTNSAYGHHTRT